MKTIVFGIDGGRFVLGLFYISSMTDFLQRPPIFVLERLLSCVKIALIANKVLFKTLSKSIYASFMTRGSSQCVLNAKITDPKYLCPVFLSG